MLINGTHAVIEALQHQATGTIYISQTNKSYAQISALAYQNKCTLIKQNTHELKARGARQGVLFQTASLKNTHVPNLKQWLSNNDKEHLSIVILDHILDPQNYGAIIRTACLFGIDLLIQPERRMAPENEISARSASGGMSILPRCIENNLAQSIKLLQEHNFWVYALEMKGTTISNIEFPKRTALVMGGEHKGVSRLLLDCCDENVSIPNNGSLESFNVSVSAAIACYELFIQNHSNG